MKWRIVPIAVKHIEGFHAAHDSVARERRYLAFLEAPPIELLREFILRNIHCGHPQFVALADGKVIGWCDVLPKQRAVFQHSGVLGMGIIDGYRGNGVGSALIATTLQAARSFGLQRIELDVRADNERAIKLYEKVGFVVEGRLRRYMYVDGAYYDGLQMGLLYE
jgi:RimJ/RimL family protein N-acetyltransferase